MRVCKVNDCNTRPKSKDLCAKHYKQSLRGTLDHVERECVIGDCGKAARPGYDWCFSHASRYFLYGDPLGSKAGLTGCKIEGCVNGHYAKGLCSTHYRNSDRRVMQPLKNEPRFPIQPFLDYVNVRGGLGELTTGLSKSERNTVEKAVSRGRRDGDWPMVTCDRVVIRVLGVHPFEVYGDEWWSQEINDDDEAVAA